jgi:hypothetical protein
MRDARDIANDVTQASWRQVRGLARELALYWLFVIIIVLGMPFAAGYVVGRARERHSHATSMGSK